jgi:hypothetical protein
MPKTKTEKVETRKHEVNLFNLPGERKYPWDLQIVETTTIENDDKIIQRVVSIHHINFNNLREFEKFQGQFNGIKTSLLKWQDRPVKKGKRDAHKRAKT